MRTDKDKLPEIKSKPVKDGNAALEGICLLLFGMSIGLIIVNSLK